MKNAAMTPWERINSELSLQKKDWKSLGDAIGATPSQMGNWKTRKIPPSHYEAIADFFNKSMDWVAGRYTPESWPFDIVDQDRYEALPDAGRYLVQVRMQDAIKEAEATITAKQETPDKKRRAA